MGFTEIVNTMDAWIWSKGLVFLCLGAGLFFSLRGRFLQVRHFGEMIRLLFDGKASTSGISSFQALAMTLAGRVGAGNIVGVAGAITVGGPGAVFWMWVVAFLGASSAFVESTLGQIYKTKIDGQYRGGPAFYMEKGLKSRSLGIFFALITIVATGFLLPGTQANAIAGALKTFNFNLEVTALVLAMLLGFIIFGGVKRIASFSELVVPFMALGYIIMAFVIIALNFSELPRVFMMIIDGAFDFSGGQALAGGIFGAVMSGVKRGVYSNEAGQGTGPHASSAAEVSHPVKQGLVQSFSVYIDTLFVCSATAFMLLITGKYNVEKDGGGFSFQGLPGIDKTGYTQAAVDSIFQNFGGIFITAALFFFVFTTIIAYYYIAETNIAYLTLNQKNQKARKTMTFILKFATMLAVIYGCISEPGTAWSLGDIGVGLMAWINVVAIFIMQKPAFLCLADYDAQKKAGLDPQFDPAKLNISDADAWKKS